MARVSPSLASILSVLAFTASVVHSQTTIPADLTPLNESAKVTIVAPGDDTKTTLEWTALGDSYASGVGTTKYVDGRRCLRYDESYPQLLNFNPYWTVPGETPVFPKGPHMINYVPCSGATAKDVVDWQLLDEPTSGKPDVSFGKRPAFGKPEFATLTAGGDDIDFPGILFNCILGIHLAVGGPPKRSCTDQRKYTWSRLNAKEYITALGTTIDAIVKKGRQGPKGNDFDLYVTGYGRFFNDETTDTTCEKTTFQINGVTGGKWIGTDGAADAILTKELRTDFNNMGDSLNAGIAQAVQNFNDDHVKYVDIQTDPAGKDLLAGHRFCEPGVNEPDPDRKDNYFWHFPYSNRGTYQPEPPNDAFDKVFNQSWDSVVKAAGGTQDSVNAKYPNFNDLWNAVLDEFTPDALSTAGESDPDAEPFWGGALGRRVKAFHPQFNLHKTMTTSILTQYALDHKNPQNPIVPPTNPDAPPYAKGTCTFHLNEWQTCVTDSENLLGDITLKDDKGNVIGQTNLDNNSIVGVSINSGDPYSLKSKLVDPLVVVGEHQGNYVRFTIGDQSWTSNDEVQDGKAGCKKPGGWDPKEGPSCGRYQKFSKRQMDCSFPC